MKTVNIVILEDISGSRTAFTCRGEEESDEAAYHLGFEGVLQEPLYSEILAFLKKLAFAEHSIISSCRNSTAHSFLCIRTNVFSSNNFKEK